MQKEQKLVSIYFNHYGVGDHGHVEEHLVRFLYDGWAVAKMVPVGSSVGGDGDTSEAGNVQGWLVVLLERQID